MMYIEYKSAKDDVTSWTGYWHIREPKPKILPTQTVVLIQADGEELDYIHETFKGLPETKSMVQVWRGDFAAFIYDNLLVF